MIPMSALTLLMVAADVVDMTTFGIVAQSFLILAGFGFVAYGLVWGTREPNRYQEFVATMEQWEREKKAASDGSIKS